MARKTDEQLAQERTAAEAGEYTTWRAVAPIPFGNAIAFMPGQPVPVSHVEQYKYDEQGLVERVRGEDKQQAAAAVPGTSVTADQP
jgi:hypothetical protein